MRVAIIGPGRLGHLLAVACARAGHPVVAVAGGSASSRATLAGLVAGCRVEDEPADAARRAELVLLTVPDDAIAAVADALALAEAVGPATHVVHCAGVHGLAPLRRAGLAGAHVAACHPAMTAPAGAAMPELLVGAAWAVTAPVDELAWAEGFVRDLGGDPHPVAEADRVLYHAALAVGANAVGAAVVTARRLLLAAGVRDPRPFLGPLVAAAVEAAQTGGAEALTGPVVRGDVATVMAHLDAVAEDLPELAGAHAALTHATLAVVRPLLDAGAADELARRLAAARPDGREDER